jgi:hypothetical protein
LPETARDSNLNCSRNQEKREHFDELAEIWAALLSGRSRGALAHALTMLPQRPADLALPRNALQLLAKTLASYRN